MQIQSTVDTTLRKRLFKLLVFQYDSDHWYTLQKQIHIFITLLKSSHRSNHLYVFVILFCKFCICNR